MTNNNNLVSMAGKQWVLPWDGSRPGWGDRTFLLRRKVPRLIRVYLEATLCKDRVEIRRSMEHPGTAIAGETADVLGTMTERGFHVPGYGMQSEPERLCRKVIGLTFHESGNQDAEIATLLGHPFWTEFLREIRDLWTVAEVMTS